MPFSTKKLSKDKWLKIFALRIKEAQEQLVMETYWTGYDAVDKAQHRLDYEKAKRNRQRYCKEVKVDFWHVDGEIAKHLGELNEHDCRS